MNTIDFIEQELNEAATCLGIFLENKENIERIEAAADIIAAAIVSGKKVISCGNGGSMSDAMHFAEELSGKYRNERKALPALAISDPGHITCVGNDYGFERIFERHVEALGQAGDVLVAISTSGNSKNVIKAAQLAATKKMKVIALTGKDGGDLKLHCEIELRAPQSKYADRVQEVHIKIIHCLIGSIEKKLGL